MKLCECGCGQATPLRRYSQSKARGGGKRGEPLRFIQGHGAQERGQAVNQARAQAVEPRRQSVLAMYRKGHALVAIAEAIGASKQIVARDVEVLRARGEDLAYRCEPSGRYPQEGQARDDLIRRFYVDEAMPSRWVARKLKISNKALKVRLRQLDISPNRGGPTKEATASDDTLRELQKSVARRRLERSWDETRHDHSLTQKQRDVLDALRASPEPMTVRRILDVLEGLSHDWRALTNDAIHGTLRRLEARGLVASVEIYQGRRRVLWVPAAADVADVRSLEDARRARELQTLIEEQKKDRDFVLLRERGMVSLSGLGEEGREFLESYGKEDEELLAVVDGV